MTKKSPKKRVLPIWLAVSIGLGLVLSLWLLAKVLPSSSETAENVGEEVDPGFLFGYSLREYDAQRYEVASGETFGGLMNSWGVGASTVDQLLTLGRDAFNPRKWRAGDAYWLLRSKDSTAQVTYFVYEPSVAQYVVFGLRDSLFVNKIERPKVTKERAVGGEIEGSLYATLERQGVSPAVAVKLSEVYAWTIDFFRIQAGDRFEVIYEESYVDDTVFVGTGKILAARFFHNGKSFYAFKYENQDGSVKGYYDHEGEGMKRMFLKAPLEFARITSRYTMNRFHPVQKRWKAHLGTDYAAPTGTPILATASGTVIAATYTSANGNYVKIKHNGTYTTQYLHMSRIGKGIRNGVRVEQGQVIGYVGSTGLATGPHVCYRFWKNGKQVDPLREPIQRADPLPRSLWSNFESVMKPRKAVLDSLANQG
jgi:murein DD-endopeptidase MepM/ murein hydrolase activator NlpD